MNASLYAPKLSACKQQQTHTCATLSESAQQGYDCAWGIDAGLGHYEVHMQKLINNKCADSERSEIHRRVTVREWSCEYRVWKLTSEKLL